MVVGYSYENQYRFILQTGLRTGELIGLKWSDIDFKNKTMKIERSMEFRYSVGEWKDISGINLNAKNRAVVLGVVLGQMAIGHKARKYKEKLRR